MNGALTGAGFALLIGPPLLAFALITLSDIQLTKREAFIGCAVILVCAVIGGAMYGAGSL